MLSKAGKDYGWLTGSAAFYVSVTNKWRDSNRGTSYPFSKQGVEDFVAQIFGQDAAKAIDPSFGGAASRTFNLGAIFNKEIGAAIGLEILESVWPNKHTRTVKNVLQPPLLGWGVGRVFDDDPRSGGSRSGAQAIIAHQYPNPSGSNTGRAFAVNSAGPWT